MPFTYQPAALIISIPTTSPEALHNSIAMAIISSLKYQMQSNQPMPPEVKEGNIYLLSMLATMQPNERQLCKIGGIV